MYSLYSFCLGMDVGFSNLFLHAKQSSKIYKMYSHITNFASCASFQVMLNVALLLPSH